MIDQEIKPQDQTIDTISSLFEERDRQPLQEDADRENAKKQPAPTLSSQPDEKKAETEAAKGDDQAIDRPDLKALQAELEKTKKAFTDTQKYGHTNARKIKSAQKQAQLLVESGALSEDEAQTLLASLEGDFEETVNEPNDPLSNILKIPNGEYSNFKKYNEDPLLDEKVKSFDFLLSLSSQKKVQEILEELSDLAEEPLNLVKKMLSLGNDFYESTGREIINAGGIPDYIEKQQDEIQKLNKNIDKLTKKLADYEEYDQPRQRISEVGESKENPPGKRDTISDLFESRDRYDQRKQKRLA